ncbi:immunity protein Imm33 domain-containing protein [Acinetobacter pullicarnis]|uniref:immunity protein Imm33 domain-containing protein n=1 Tax=Acinetobacter pullicarnis TaxID=2576829 RepID=UPI001E400D8C|nr:hypothetical protein [Acinetobacter pullicarnis]
MKLQDLIDEQKLLCEEFDSAYIEVKGDDLVAVALQSIKQEPIVGIRKKPIPGESVAWYIYGGELQTKDEDFEIMSIKELQDILPEVLPYLALDHGYRFMIDQDDYEDVWKEEAF